MNMLPQGAKGGGSSTPTQAPDTLSSVSYAQMLDLVSEGPIYGPPSGDIAQSIYLNDVPLKNADGSFNFVVSSYDYRPGTVDQTYVPGFDGAQQIVNVGVSLTHAVPWNLTISDLTQNAVIVTLGVSSLSSTDPSSGNVSGYSVAYQIQVQVDGGAWQTVVNTAFNGKCTSSYQRSHRINLSGASSAYNLRVIRVTQDNTTVYIQDKTSVVSYALVVDAKLRYPYSAVAALSVDAVQFSSVPTRSYDLKGLLVSVPSNYNPVTRVYTGAWDGTFVQAWTDNPAWIYYDLVLNNRYGAGQWVNASQVDRYGLYQIAQYCDQMVSDGMGGQEPRFTCNCYIQSRADAYKVLQDLASVFRGMSYWAAGNVVVSADMPQQPTYLYTAANVIGGKFKYVGSSLKTRYTAAVVTWNNPQNGYKQEPEYVEDVNGIARYGINRAQVTAFGCTSRGQAQRVGQWIILTSRYETDTVTFSVGLDGTLPRPGQIIQIADPNRAGQRTGGRIKSASSTSVITVDIPVSTPVTVTAGNLGTGDGGTRTFQTVDANGNPLNSSVSVSAVFRNDWQGNKQLFTTTRTNNIRYSADFTQTVWAKTASGTGTAPVVTANAGTAPDGTLTAERIVFSRGTGTTTSDYSRIEQSQTTITGQTFSQGVWLRSYDGVSTYSLQLSFSNASPVILTVTPAWTYYENAAIASDTIRGFRLETRGTSGTASADVLVWGAMQVQGATAGSYIPTTSAAASVTDYSATASGQITLFAAPAQGAVLTWSGTGSTLTGNAPAIAPGSMLTVALPTGVTAKSTVSAVDSTGTTLTVNPPFSAVPLAGAVWLVESATLAAQTFRIMSIAEKDGIEFEVTATQYNASKFGAVDTGASIDVLPITSSTFTTQVPPSGVTVSQWTVIDQGITKTNLTVSWQPAANAISYRVQIQKDSGAWVDIGTTGQTSVDLTNIYAGGYIARVSCTNGAGISSVYAYSTLTTLSGKTTPPPVVSSLTATTNQVFAVTVNWAFPVGSGDTKYTEVWYSHTNDFTTASQLGTYSYPTNEAKLLGLVAGYDLYFWARLVDTSGNTGAWYPAAPPSGTYTGVHGMSSMDASSILQYLTGQITSTQLAQSLAQPIALLTPPEAGDMNSYAGGTSVYAGVSSEQSSREAADMAIATKLDTVQAAIYNNNTALFAAVQTETTARISADAATASQLTTIQAQADSNTAAIQVNAQSYAALNGTVSAIYTIKTQVTSNGKTYVAGIGLSSDNTNGSQVLVTADRFAVLETVGGNTFSPFVIQNGQAFINQAFIGNAWITNAMIANAAITGAQIQNAAIQNANIANGAIASAQIQNAAIANAHIQNAAISSANIQNAAIQNAHIADAQIDTLKLGANAATSAASFGFGAGGAATYWSSGGALAVFLTANNTNATWNAMVSVGGSNLQVSNTGSGCTFMIIQPAAGGVGVNVASSQGVNSITVVILEFKR